MHHTFLLTGIFIGVGVCLILLIIQKKPGEHTPLPSKKEEEILVETVSTSTPPPSYRRENEYGDQIGAPQFAGPVPTSRGYGGNGLGDPPTGRTKVLLGNNDLALPVIDSEIRNPYYYPGQNLLSGGYGPGVGPGVGFVPAGALKRTNEYLNRRFTFNPEWQNIGILTLGRHPETHKTDKSDGQTHSDHHRREEIMNLHRRDISPNNDVWEYMAEDRDGFRIRLDQTQFIEDGDEISHIPGKHGLWKAHIYTDKRWLYF